MKPLPLVILPLCLLAGCQSIPKKENIVKQDVLVTVPCKIQPVEKPVMPLTENGTVKDSIFVKVKKALAEIDLRKSYETKLESAVKACQ